PIVEVKLCPAFAGKMTVGEDQVRPARQYLSGGGLHVFPDPVKPNHFLGIQIDSWIKQRPMKQRLQLGPLYEERSTKVVARLCASTSDVAEERGVVEPVHGLGAD